MEWQGIRVFSARSRGRQALVWNALIAIAGVLGAANAYAQATIHPYSPRLEIVEQEVGWRVVSSGS